MDAATLTYDTLGFGEFEDFPETSEPVWILGKEFNALTEKDDILSDVTSRLWFTYRKNFPPIGGTGPTSDTGWGCMLRCGQMILGEALVCRHLGRDWRWVRGQPPRGEYIGILNAFLDKKDSYYSLHQIEQLCMPWLDYGGAACAEPPGWMPTHNGCLEGACALAEEETALWKPLVLLIPLRLGLSDINKAYIETLKQCFQLPQSLGVIGGKPNSAHYFIGYVGEELIYLDPHTTQSAVEPCEDSQVPDDTYHCQHPPCRMHICEIDPSVAVGFFCRTEDDFDDWCMRIRKLSHTRGSLPMFELVDCQPSHFACSVDVLNLTPDEAGIQSEVRCGQARCTTDKAPFKGNFPDVRGDRVHDFSDRLERFFDSEDEEFEILSL
ncbi:cysteine protease ATG4B isoform X2 [Salmo salar]|uniref:Cysteine protease n=1 Tax=Salmo salar TaxID=8030 RepID=A0A1S3MQ83_SALSA|nr:cysteine protease ATG4B-like isoform X2 [Salmo salar]|eukprot:XP_014005342.1 PREDICTED: cysteine protease ATG4B-like isoform X2 [Salmo salar]